MKLLYLSLASFILVATTSLAINVSFKNSNFTRETGPRVSRSFTPIPVISNNSSFPIISAQAALAIDLPSGTTLYEKNPDAAVLPASTTKIVTALVAMDYYPEDYVLKVKDIKVEGQKMGLKEGEEVKVEDLLYGLLIFSANDAAQVLAQNYPGGRELFVAAMNLKAKKLFLENSNFVNPTGLDGEVHVSTARDMVRVSAVAMRNPRFARIVGTEKWVVRKPDGKIAHTLVNINELLGSVEGVRGVKTGWTENARENLVTYIERDEKYIMIALLGSQDRFGETKELIDWIFETYNWQEVKIEL